MEERTTSVGRRWSEEYRSLGTMYRRSLLFSLIGNEKVGASFRNFPVRGAALPVCGGCCCCCTGAGVGGGPLERWDRPRPCFLPACWREEPVRIAPNRERFSRTDCWCASTSENLGPNRPSGASGPWTRLAQKQTNTLSVRPTICFWRRSGGSGFSLGSHPAPGQRSAARGGYRPTPPRW